MAQMKYFYELTISSSPHVHAPVTTRTIMRDVLIALTPALLGSIYFFGLQALLVTLVSAAACVFFEWAYCRITKTNCKIYDLSAVVTGVLIAFVCPPTIPIWTILIGDFFAIILVKALFGGIGCNIDYAKQIGHLLHKGWNQSRSMQLCIQRRRHIYLEVWSKDRQRNLYIRCLDL